MSTHLDRKELKRPDAFQDKASVALDYLSKNTKALVAVGVILLVTIGAIAFYSHHKSEQNEAANSAFYLVKKDFDAALQKAPTKTADWDSGLKSQIVQIERVAKEHKGTQASYEGWLALGDAYYNHANFQKAADYYKQAIDSASSRSMKALARHSLAYAYEGSKNFDTAIEELRQVISSGEKPMKGDALMALARNFAAKGDKAKAIEQYDQIAKDFPNSALSKTAEVQKNALH